MPFKKRKYIVKAQVTLKLCAEVTAPNPEAAREAANCKCSEIEGQFLGYKADLNRPMYAVPMCDCDDQTVWWDPDSLDQCEIFLTNEAEFEIIEGPGS